MAQPQNGSSTTSPSFELARMIRSSSFGGFWVGYPTRSGAFEFNCGTSHQSSGTLPFGFGS